MKLKLLNREIILIKFYLLIKKFVNIVSFLDKIIFYIKFILKNYIFHKIYFKNCILKINIFIFFQNKKNHEFVNSSFP